MRIHKVRWCTLNKLGISFKYVTNTPQYVDVRCHMAKGSQNLVLFYTLDLR